MTQNNQMSGLTLENCIFVNVTEVTVAGPFGKRKFPSPLAAQEFVYKYRKDERALQNADE